MDKDWKKDADKDMNKLSGKMERGKIKTEKEMDNMKHDAKLKASKAKEEMKDKADEMSAKWHDRMDKNKNK